MEIKIKHLLYLLSNTLKKHLLLTEGKDEKHYVLMKDFNIFMYNHTLNGGRKHLQAFSTDKMLKSHINDCFKINGEQMIQMPKEGG